MDSNDIFLVDEIQKPFLDLIRFVIYEVAEILELPDQSFDESEVLELPDQS